MVWLFFKSEGVWYCFPYRSRSQGRSAPFSYDPYWVDRVIRNKYWYRTKWSSDRIERLALKVLSNEFWSKVFIKEVYMADWKISYDYVVSWVRFLRNITCEVHRFNCVGPKDMRSCSPSTCSLNTGTIAILWNRCGWLGGASLTLGRGVILKHPVLWLVCRQHKADNIMHVVYLTFGFLDAIASLGLIIWGRNEGTETEQVRNLCIYSRPGDRGWP